MKRRAVTTNADNLHPAQRFEAASAIVTGQPLKLMFNAAYLRLLAESFEALGVPFRRTRFLRTAGAGLEDLELLPRAAHIAAALIGELPDDAASRSRILRAALGPELAATAGNGLAPFFYLPHSHAIATACLEDFHAGMQANYELTRRFTAEFSIRPYIVAHQQPALALLREWTQDVNPHVRRLVSEGTRPRLPWAMRLKAIQADPGLTLPLLEALKDDEDLYVRRSVANHLADILKDHPEVAYATCERWIREARRKSVPEVRRQQRFWMVRHAVRLPAKKEDARAVEIRRAAKQSS